MTFDSFLKNRCEDVDPVLAGAVQAPEFNELSDKSLSEISQYFLAKCKQNEVPRVLQALTREYQSWTMHLLVEIDAHLEAACSVNALAVQKDLEWLLPGRHQFWFELRTTLYALREDIAEFRQQG